MEWSRREVLGTVAGSLGAVAASTAIAEAMVAQPKARARPANEPFGYCLNTSTIRGNQLDIVQVVAAASKAGFHAIEPWITELDAYTKGGGSLKDLGKRIADAGLTVENAIAFNSFLTDDETQRATGMERMKVDMDKVAQIGGARIAAVPGNSRGTCRDPRQRRQVLPRGARNGREDGGACRCWNCGARIRCSARCGTASTWPSPPAGPTRACCSTCSICTRAAQPFTSLKQINGGALHVMHINDYPQAADPVDAE